MLIELPAWQLKTTRGPNIWVHVFEGFSDTKTKQQTFSYYDKGFAALESSHGSKYFVFIFHHNDRSTFAANANHPCIFLSYALCVAELKWGKITKRSRPYFTTRYPPKISMLGKISTLLGSSRFTLPDTINHLHNSKTKWTRRYYWAGVKVKLSLSAALCIFINDKIWRQRPFSTKLTITLAFSDAQAEKDKSKTASSQML